MRRKLTPIEGGHLWRMSHWCPADPEWCSLHEVRSVRLALKRHDALLNLWWEPARRRAQTPDIPGRWRVVRWMQTLGNHDTVFYWEGDNGSYRGLDGAATAMVNRLQMMEQKTMKELDRECEEHNAEVDRKRRAEHRENMERHWEDFNKRAYGVRQTFAPGYIRRREVKPQDLGNTNLDRYMRSRK